MSERRLVNAVTAGVAYVGESESERWWSWSRFRLVPLFHRRPGDDWNPPAWNFDWLGLSIWSKDCPDIKASVCLDDMGLHFRIEPPYIHLEWSIPLFPFSWHQKLWRKSRRTRGDA